MLINDYDSKTDTLCISYLRLFGGGEKFLEDVAVSGEGYFSCFVSSCDDPQKVMIEDVSEMTRTFNQREELAQKIYEFFTPRKGVIKKQIYAILLKNREDASC